MNLKSFAICAIWNQQPYKLYSFQIVNEIIKDRICPLNCISCNFNWKVIRISYNVPHDISRLVIRGLTEFDEVVWRKCCGRIKLFFDVLVVAMTERSRSVNESLQLRHFTSQVNHHLCPLNVHLNGSKSALQDALM